MLSEEVKTQAAWLGAQVRDFRDLGLDTYLQHARLKYRLLLICLETEEERRAAEKIYQTAYLKPPMEFKPAL